LVAEFEDLLDWQIGLVDTFWCARECAVVANIPAQVC